MILEQLAEGSVTLTAIRLLAPHLTPENHRDVLDAAQHKSKREIEVLVAELRPRPVVPSSVRKLPAVSTAPAQVDAVASASTSDVPTPRLEPAEPTAATSAPAPAPQMRRTAVVAPLTPEQYKCK